MRIPVRVKGMLALVLAATAVVLVTDVPMWLKVWAAVLALSFLTLIIVTSRRHHRRQQR